MVDAMKTIHPWALVVLEHLDFTGLTEYWQRESERIEWSERGPRIVSGVAHIANLQRLAPFVWQVHAANHPESLGALVQLLRESRLPFRVLWFAEEPKWMVHHSPVA